jgi:hypothetical protein
LCFNSQQVELISKSGLAKIYQSLRHLAKELSSISFAYINQFFITKISLKGGPFIEEPNKKIIKFFLMDESLSLLFHSFSSPHQ